MNTEFECVECKHRFNDDINNFVNCPNCGSDNVKPASKRNLKYVIFSAIFIVAAVAGFFIVNNATEKQDIVPTDDIEYTTNEETTTTEHGFRIDEKHENDELQWGKEEEFAEEVEPEEECQAPVEIINVNLEIEVHDLKYAKDSKTYSFKAKCKNAPEGIVLLWTLATDDNKIIAESESGEFKDIAPLENDDTYLLTVKGKNEQYNCNGYIYVKECKVVKEEAQIAKLSVADVQASIDDSEGIILDKYQRSGQILNKLKIKVVDWGGYEEGQYETLEDLIIDANMAGFAIKVVNVGHNAIGTVNYIEITLESNN